MRERVKKVLFKIIILLITVNLPFLTLTQIFGINNFIDSYNNPEDYQYYKVNDLSIKKNENSLIVIQRTAHPDFEINEGDEIFHLFDEGGLLVSTVYKITQNGPVKRYYVLNFDNVIESEPIYDFQIIGKVVNRIDNNPWNSLTLKIWDISKNNLNAVALLSS